MIITIITTAVIIDRDLYGVGIDGGGDVGGGRCSGGACFS